MSADAAQASERALAGWLVLGARQIAVTGLTVVAVIVLGRLLGPSDFAIFGYTTTAVTAALSVGDLGLGSRVIRERLDGRQLGEVLGLQLAVCAGLTAAGAAAGAVMIASGGHVAEVAIAGCIVAATIFALLQTLPTAVLEQRLAFGAIGRIEVGQELVFVAGAIALATLGSKRLAVPIAALGAGLGAYAATLLAARWRARPRLAAPRRVLTGWALDWWIGRLAAQFAYIAIPTLGGALLGSRPVGRLTIALNIAALATILAPLVSRATFPAMAGTDPAGRVPVFRRVFGTYLVASIPALLVIVVGAPVIVALALGPEWTPAIPDIRVGCLAAVVGLAFTPSLPLFYMVLDPVAVRRVLVAWFAGQWMLGAVLAEAIGESGLLIAAALATGWATWTLDRRLRRSVSGFSLVREAAPPLAAGGVAAAGGLVAAAALGGSRPAIAAATVLALIVYVIVLGRRRGALAPRSLLQALRTAGSADAPGRPDESTAATGRGAG